VSAPIGPLLLVIDIRPPSFPFGLIGKKNKKQIRREILFQNFLAPKMSRFEKNKKVMKIHPMIHNPQFRTNYWTRHDY
jgi:hypothetical protein